MTECRPLEGCSQFCDDVMGCSFHPDDGECADDQCTCQVKSIGGVWQPGAVEVQCAYADCPRD